MSVRQYLISAYGAEAVSADGVYRAVCPFCHNPKRKFYLLFNYGVYKCFHCTASSSLYRLMKHFHAQDFDHYAGDLAALRGSNFTAPLSAEVDLQPVPMISGFQPLASVNKVTSADGHAGMYLNYLYSRGIDYKTIREFNLGFTPDKPYHLIIPVNDLTGAITYYTTRAIKDIPGEKAYFPPAKPDQFSKRHAILNINRAAHAPAVYIVEGPFDCMSCVQSGFNTVALLGKEMTAQQVKTFQLAGFKQVIVALDADAEGAAFKLGDEIAKYITKDVQFCPMPKDADPNSLLLDGRLVSVLSHPKPFPKLRHLRINGK